MPQGYANNDDDGNDQNGEINPANGEKCNGIDDNGDGVIPDNEKDTDHDGYVPCTPWSGAVTLKGGDCIDHDNQTHPGATELCDDIDNNCDGAISDDEQDKDGDKWVGCAGWANRDGNHPDIHGGGDCDQSNGQIYPGADEFFDSHDDDCDGYVDECIIDCNCGADLFACYTLDDSSLADGSANHNTASVTSGGVSIVVAKVNNGVDFASTQKITAPKSNAQEHTEFTLSAWVNVAAWPTARGYVTDVRSEYTMRFASDGTFTCAFADTNDNIWESTTTAGLVSLGVYNHVACTYDGETLITYVNGLARASQATGGAVVRDSQNFPLAIGDGNATSGPFIGVIDHLQGFGTAHTAHQICVAAEYAGCP